jgi:hypothetical protein
MDGHFEENFAGKQSKSYDFVVGKVFFWEIFFCRGYLSLGLLS